MAMPASLPEGTMSAYRAVSSDMVSPSKSPALDSPTVAASLSTVTVRSRGAFSSATTAVMIFVSDAIFTSAFTSREKYTVPSDPTSIACVASISGHASAERPRAATVLLPISSLSSTSAKAAAGAESANVPASMHAARMRPARETTEAPAGASASNLLR